jgi:hypothetical protein
MGLNRTAKGIVLLPSLVLGACRTFPQAQPPLPPFLGGELGELLSAGA